MPHKKPKPAASKTISLSAVKEIQDSGKKAHLRAATTRKNYSAHIKRGQEWIRSHCTTAEPMGVIGMDAEASFGMPHPEGLSSGENVRVDNDLFYDTPEFKKALDGAPNEYSSKALALYISYKCFYQNLTQSTADGIYSAFKRYWEEM